MSELHSVHVDNLPKIDEAPDTVVTDEDVVAINAARNALERIAGRCAAKGWDALREGYQASLRANFASPQSYGRLAGTCVMADDALFSVLNIANAYLYLLTEEQIHNTAEQR